jgi:IS30 family transposase
LPVKRGALRKELTRCLRMKRSVRRRGDCTQAGLDAIADEFNGRPRHTLDWMTPSQALDRAMR